MLRIDDLFTPKEESAAELLASSEELSSKEHTIVLDIALDTNINTSTDLLKSVDMLKKYIYNTFQNIKYTIEASRTAELVKDKIIIVTGLNDCFDDILKEKFSDNFEIAFSPNLNIQYITIRIYIYEDFKSPVQLIRFISQLFENTKNKRIYSRNKHREIFIYKKENEDSYIDIQNIDFKELILEKRHERHKRRLSFSERTAFEKILKVCYYVMGGRCPSLDIYKRARYNFKMNFNIEIMSAAHNAICHDDLRNTSLNLSTISDIEGFNFLFGRIRLIDFCEESLVWWKNAQFVFYNTAKTKGYYIYDFDLSKDKTGNSKELFEECKQFYDFEFPFETIFQAGFITYKLTEDMYFVMAIKLGPIVSDKVNDGLPYETTFIYKERVKEPDSQLTVLKFQKKICDSIISEYVDNNFRMGVKKLLEINFKKSYDELHH